MKQTVIVLAPKFKQHSNHIDSSVDNSDCLQEKSWSNIGLPTSSGVVLAFRGRLDLSEMDLGEYNADFCRIPIEKLNVSEYEEREQQRKLMADYEDIGLGGSDASLDDCGANNLRRSHSAGGLEQREKRRNLDKVRRLSRALNPKHWRNRQEPEPLPPPTAMGLLALAARPPAAHSNDYVDRQDEEQEQLVHKTSSTHSGSTNTGEESGGEEDENLYEDVEIGPIKSSTLAASSAPRRGPFSGMFHQSMPANRRSPKLPSRGPKNKNTDLDRSADNLEVEEAATGKYVPDGATPPGIGRDGYPAYDVPKQQKGKALRWASKLGDKIQARYDVPKLWGSKGKDEQKSIATDEDISSLSQCGNFDPANTSSQSPPTMRAPSPPLEPPPRTTSLAASAGRSSEPENVKEDPDGPVAPARRRKRGARASKAIPDIDNEKVTEQPRTGNLLQGVTSSMAADTSDIAKVQPRPRPLMDSGDTVKVQPRGPLMDSGDTVKVQPRGLLMDSGDTFKVQPRGPLMDSGDTVKVQPRGLLMDSGDTFKVQPRGPLMDSGDTVKVQPRPRNSILRTEQQLREESQPVVVPPRPKPRGLKSQLPTDDSMSRDNGYNIGNIINSTESLDIGETKIVGCNSQAAKAAPQVKPRTTS